MLLGIENVLVYINLISVSSIKYIDFVDLRVYHAQASIPPKDQYYLDPNTCLAQVTRL
jgi:hypothetical protein